MRVANVSENSELFNGWKITQNGSVPGKENVKNASSMQEPDFVATIMRTTEEFMKWQEEQSEKIGEEWAKTHLSFVEQWNREHPNLAGTKCIRHTNGRWCTVEEIVNLWNEELKSDGTVFERTKS